MNPRRPLIIIRRPAHIPIIRTIRNIKHLRRNLRAQESRFIIAHFFPLGEVLGELDELDARRRLAVAGV